MRDGLDIVFVDVDRDLRDAKSQVESDLQKAGATSERLDDVDERIRRLADQLPEEALDAGEERSAEDVPPQKRMRLVSDGEDSPERSKTWGELQREATARLVKQGINPSAVSIDDVLDAATCQRIEERYGGNFQLQADLDAYDVWAAVAAGTVAAVVDFFLVKIPQDHLYLDKYPQEGSPLTKWLQGKNDSEQHWIAQFAKRLESDYKTSFDGVRPIMEEDLVEGFYPKTHRLQTFGHDPLLGLIIGTIDVMRGGMTAISRDGIPVLLSGEDVPGGLRPPVLNALKAFWTTLMHMVSDVTTKMGLQPPGFTMLQAFDVGSFGENDRTIGELARFMYLKGYDSRHFLTMSTSVAAAEVVLRGYYFMRRRFDDEYEAEVTYAAEVAGESSWRFDKHPRFMGMKLTAHAIGAAMNAGKVAFYVGNPLAINYAQWLSFTRDALRFAKMKTKSPSEVIRGHALANARALEEGWNSIDVSDPEFPELVISS
jgi:hypothetical protein